MIAIKVLTVYDRRPIGVDDQQRPVYRCFGIYKIGAMIRKGEWFEPSMQLGRFEFEAEDRYEQR